MHDSALITLGLMDVKPARFEAEILDAKVERLTDAQATSVEQVNE